MILTDRPSDTWRPSWFSVTSDSPNGKGRKGEDVGVYVIGDWVGSDVETGTGRLLAAAVFAVVATGDVVVVVVVVDDDTKEEEDTGL